MGSTSAQRYGGCVKDQRLSDRVGSLTLFLFNPLMWIIDAALQKIWPLTDPQPPKGIGLRRRVLWETQQFVKDLAFVTTGLLIILALLGLIGA